MSTTQEAKPTAQGTPQPLSEAERKEIESRGWEFTESGGWWSARNERLDEQTQECSDIEQAVECILAIEYRREEAKGQPTLTPLGELIGFISASSTGRKRDETEKRFPMNLINRACQEGHIAWEANRRRYIIWNKPMPQASEPEVEIDFDLVPNDPHKRNWSSLSDFQLDRWGTDLIGMKSEHSAAWKLRVMTEMELRDSIEELTSNKEFDLPAELTQPRSTYADALRQAEVVKAEQQRRSAPVATDPDTEITIDVREMRREAFEGSLDAIDAAEGMSIEYADDASQSEIVQANLFDYAQLDISSAIIVKRCAEDIRGRVLSLISSIKNARLEIGRRLREAKPHLVRGTYPDWLKREFQMSVDTADRYIKYANFFDENPQRAEIIGRIDPTAVYLLEAPDVPDDARVEATARAEAGEQITSQTAREIVKTHRVTKTESTVTKSANKISDQSTTDDFENNIPAESQLQESPESIPPELPAVDAASQSAAETKAWNDSVIKINLTLFKHDNDPAGRRVMMSLGADDDKPEITWHREVELFRSLPSGSESLPVRDVLRFYEHDLPSTVTSGLANIAIGLPARAVKQIAAAAPAVKPAANKPTVKATAKKLGAKKAAAKKPAAKKAAAPQKDKKKGGGVGRNKKPWTQTSIVDLLPKGES
ncbi:MAG: DUF3102 domain-containing protein [Blastocatellia bacterium]